MNLRSINKQHYSSLKSSASFVLERNAIYACTVSDIITKLDTDTRPGITEEMIPLVGKSIVLMCIEELNDKDFLLRGLGFFWSSTWFSSITKV